MEAPFEVVVFPAIATLGAALARRLGLLATLGGDRPTQPTRRSSTCPVHVGRPGRSTTNGSVEVNPQRS